MEQKNEFQKETTEIFDTINTETLDKSVIFIANKYNEKLSETAIANIHLDDDKHGASNIMYNERGDGPNMHLKRTSELEISNSNEDLQNYDVNQKPNIDASPIKEHENQPPFIFPHRGSGDSPSFFTFSKSFQKNPEELEVTKPNKNLDHERDNEEDEQNVTDTFLPEDYSTQQNFMSWKDGLYYRDNCEFTPKFWNYVDESKEEYAEQYKEESHDNSTIEESYSSNLTNNWIPETKDYIPDDFYNFANTDIGFEEEETNDNFSISELEKETQEVFKDLDFNDENIIRKEYNFPRIKYTKTYLLQFSDCILAYPLPESLRVFTKNHDLPLKQWDIPKQPPIQPTIPWRFHPNMTHLEFYKKVQQDIDTRRRTTKLQD